MELVALLSTGKGSWNEVSKIIEAGEWDNIILVGNEFAKKFSSPKKAEFILANLDADAETLKKELMEKLKNKFSGLEVALSIASGTGREHMALISALLQIPVGVKFVAMSEKGIVQL